MRELVYLSEGKLEQFLPELRTLWPQPKLSVKVPFGGVAIDLASTPRKSQLKHLKRVVKQVKRSARWFSDQYLAAGEWVAFEAPLNYVVMDCGPVSMLFFVDTGRATDRYPSGNAMRLLLHGSPQNLVGICPIQVPAPPGNGEQTTSRFAVDLASSNCSVPATFGYVADNIATLVRTLDRQSDPASVAHQAKPGPPARYLPMATFQVVQALDEQVPTETAAWMRGYARITANLADDRAVRADGETERYVVASPLYIERSPFAAPGTTQPPSQEPTSLM